MKPTTFLLSLLMIIFWNCSSSDDSSKDSQDPPTSIYFPPIDGSDTWENSTPQELGWNNSALQPLLDYLEEKNSKGFIILHKGKIVVEHYMNGHQRSSNWYWASAGKTLTATVSGIAQDEGLIDIDNRVSDHLGAGWTSAPLDKEQMITCKNLLSMNSGLDDSLGDDVSPANLQYVADAGNRWAYHNVYVKMQDVVAEASNQTWNSYFNTKLRDKIGMNGVWIPVDDLSVYWSNTRSMARFGLLIYAKGEWDDTRIVSENYITESTSTSQDLNEAYGYMWWLNGKSSFKLPGLQLEFQGELIPNAPDDMFSGLGKNDQKLYIVPSKDLVIVRVGDVANPENPTFGLSGFDNELWSYINAFID